ncbi:MAG: dsDNA nuclease domain-containing protein [Pirellulales bacterium]
MSVSPDRVQSADDPGDDTQRRFRYQATQAALLALSILDDDAQIEEIFCEHHEDILLRQRCGTFIGYQVKTRQVGGEPLKAGDQEVVSAVRRFIVADQRFPSHFARYVLGSTTGFWRERKNGSNLPHLRDLARNSNAGVEPTLVTYLKKLCIRKSKKAPDSPSCSNGDGSGDPGGDNPAVPGETEESRFNLAQSVLKKVRFDTLPGLNDIWPALIRQLRACSAIGDRFYSDLERTAAALVDAMLAAAALAHADPRERYLALWPNPSKMKAEATISGKRITKDGLLSVLQESLEALPTLCTSGHVSLDQFPKGMRRLELKLAAGGLSLSNIDLAKDQKASAEFLLAQWIQKHGEARARAQYEHVSTVVRTECQEAHDHNRDVSRLFGPQMLEEIRARLRSRQGQEAPALFGCKYEHLLGVGAILTEDCKLWWSDAFDLPMEAVT